MGNMDKRISIILFDDEEVTKTLVESYLSEITFSYNFVNFTDFDEVLIPSDDNKKIIIVNINKTILKNIEILYKIAHNKNNKLVIISYDKSTDIQVKALRCGAKDFLFKPLIKSEFLNSLQKIYYDEINVKDKIMGSKIYSVISVTKGVGKTFFVLNLAKQLAKQSGEKVLIVDFNNNLTDIFQILNMEVHYTTIRYVNEMTNENAAQMLSKLVNYGDVPLYILGTGMCSNINQSLNDNHLSNFFSILKNYYKYIIIDNDSSLGKSDEIIINNADFVYLIIEPSLLMAEDADSSIMKYRLKNKAVRIILNKYKEQKDEALLDKIEGLVGRPIFTKIPKNYIAANSSFDKGVTIDEVNPDVDITRTYEQLAKYMIDSDE